MTQRHTGEKTLKKEQHNMRKNFRHVTALLVTAIVISGCPLWIDLGPDELLTADDIPGTWYQNFNWCCDNSWAGEAYITFYEGGGLSNSEISLDYCSKLGDVISESEPTGVAKSGWSFYENENGDSVFEFTLGGTTYRCVHPYKDATLNGSMWVTNDVTLNGCFKLTKQ